MSFTYGLDEWFDIAPADTLGTIFINEDKHFHFAQKRKGRCSTMDTID